MLSVYYYFLIAAIPIVGFIVYEESKKQKVPPVNPPPPPPSSKKFSFTENSVSFPDGKIIYSSDLDDSDALADFENWDNIVLDSNCNRGIQRYFLDSIAYLRENAAPSAPPFRSVATRFHCDEKGIFEDDVFADGSHSTWYQIGSNYSDVGDYLEDLLELDDAAPLESLVDFGVLAS